MSDEIVNKVDQSSLVQFDLATLYHHGKRTEIDLADHLFQGMVIREKDLRDYIKETDWSTYKNQNVAIYCSVDAIVPTWAYMLIAAALNEYANFYFLGTKEELENALFLGALSKVDLKKYEDALLVVKGCGNIPVPTSAYVELVRVFQPVVKSLMFGEPCSTVPVYKKKKSPSK